MNRRNLIRQEIAQRIEAHIQDIPIYLSRTSALNELDLPCIIVSIDSETSEPYDATRREVKKVANISIEILVTADEEQSVEFLDNITGMIEHSLLTCLGLQKAIDYIELKSTEITSVREGEIELGAARMLFEAHYYSGLDESLTNVSVFEGTQVSFGNFQGVNQ